MQQEPHSRLNTMSSSCTYLLDKGASTTVYHKDKGGWPRFHFSILDGATGVPLGCIDILITEIRIRVKEVGGN